MKRFAIVTLITLGTAGYFGIAYAAYTTQPGPMCKVQTDNGYCTKPLTYRQMVKRVPHVVTTLGACVHMGNC